MEVEGLGTDVKKKQRCKDYDSKYNCSVSILEEEWEVEGSYLLDF